MTKVAACLHNVLAGNYEKGRGREATKGMRK